MSKTLHGQGTTPERMKHSKITRAVREITTGGMIGSYGQHDTEHCTLDYLLNQGLIKRDHYDAGYNLRTIYYVFNKTGINYEDMGGNKAYDGDYETPADKAEMLFARAMKSISPDNKSLTRYACIEGTKALPDDFNIIQTVIDGLEELGKFFKKNTCNKI